MMPAVSFVDRSSLNIEGTVRFGVRGGRFACVRVIRKVCPDPSLMHRASPKNRVRASGCLQPAQGHPANANPDRRDKTVRGSR